MSPSTTTNQRRHSQERSESAPAIKYRGRLMFVPAALVLFLASCANHSELTEAQAAIGRSFEAPEGKALICVYHPSKPFTDLIKRPVFINGQHIASTGSGTFIAVPVRPGAYTVQAAAQALIDSPEYRKAYPDITLKLTAGQSIFIRQTVGESTSNHQSSMMMLQTGDTPIPLSVGGGPPPFGAVIVDRDTDRSECSGLKQVAVEALEASISR